MTLIVDGTTGVTFNDSSLQGAAASPFGLKNRIINGDMVVSQRNGTSSVSIDNTEKFVVDRFLIRSNASGLSATSQQSTIVPNNFVNSMIVSVTTGGTIAAATRGYIQQRIEGFNVADLGWGAAGASTVTLSFWVRSSKTGTFSGALQNDPSLANRSYVFTYSISSANTWEQKSITIIGDTTGTWYKNNLPSINVMFDLGNGSDLRTAPTGSWVTGDFRGANSSVNIFDTSGATFYFTGVQLERNTTATPFEWLPYTTELQLCQRYALMIRNGTTSIDRFGLGSTVNSTTVQLLIQHPVQMRAAPTLTTTGTASDYAVYSVSVTTCNAAPTLGEGSQFNSRYNFVTAGGLTGGQVAQCQGANTNAYLLLSAEI